MKKILVPMLLSAFLGPGVGQLYNRNYKKGFFLLSVVLLALVGLFAAFIVIAKEEIVKSEDILLTPGFEVILAQQIIKEHPLPLTLFKWGFILLWCYSVVDAYLVANRKRGQSPVGTVPAGTDTLGVSVPILGDSSSAVTVAQMQEIDRRSETEFGVTSLELMENAGRAVAQEILVTTAGIGAAARLGTDTNFPRKLMSVPAAASIPAVVILCGKGNNGGDGMVVARYLHKAEVPVEVFYLESSTKAPRPEVKTQIEKLKEAGIQLAALQEGDSPHSGLPADQTGTVPLKVSLALKKASLVVDALLGTGSQGEPTGLMKTLIDEINNTKKPVLALDIPSGLDADTGKASSSCVKAQWTVTLGLAKVGLLKEQAKPYVGKLIVVDIGHPKKLVS